MRLPPTLYVHTPFCRAKCRYCAFFSMPVGPGGVAPAILDRYLAVLEAEMDRQAKTWAGNLALGPAPSVFFGGGTPSLLGPAGLARVLSALRERFPIALDAEITLEANPDSATPEFLAAAHHLGVNRLSLGAQSLDDRALAALGRAHNARAVRQTMHDARRAGFENIGLDLIFGLPGQTPADWLSDLRRVLDLAPQHLSCYGLGIEPGTPLARDAAALAALPGEDAQAEMFLRGAELLEAAGYAQYEISNFARGPVGPGAGPDWRCRHNLACWRGRDVLGFGPAACSTITLRHRSPASPAGPAGAKAMRWTNPANLSAWEALVESGRAGEHGREELAPELRAREALMLALRTTEGLDLAHHRECFGQDIRANQAALLDQLRHAGLAELSGTWLRLTRAGMLVSSSVIRALAFED